MRSGPHPDSDVLEVTFTVAFSKDALTQRESNGYDIIRMDNGDYLEQPGMPMLPAKTVWVAIPAGMEVARAFEIASTSEVLPGEYTIMPAQPPTPISGHTVPRRLIEPNADVYSSDEAYPAEKVVFMRQADLGGQNMAAIRIHPIQYMASQGKIVLATSIKVAIQGTQGYECRDYLPAMLSSRQKDFYEQWLRARVINPDHIQLAGPATSPLLQGVAPGEYDYVIITDTDWADDFQPLAAWRTKLGLRATVVTTDWIYGSGSYSGTDLEKIRAFVIDAHTNWGAVYFLLGADTNLIPNHVRTITVPGYSTDDIPNDTYYADYDDDWVCEVNVGRASVRSAAQITTFLNKVFTYEKNPPPAGYVKEAAYFGMDITTCGDMDGEIFKEDYIRPHFPTGWTIDTEYDSEPGTHKADILTYLNQGYHLVNHHDHCNADCMGTGWICHGELMYTADIDALTNGDRLSILFAVGCHPAHTPTQKSIGEASIRNPNGGCVAFMGNSFVGWGGPPEHPDMYSLGQDRYFYRNLFDLGIERLGDNFTVLKNDEFDFDDPYNLHMYCFTQLHLLGDPGLAVWTDDPRILAVSHPQRAPVGEATSFKVDVASEGDPVDGATACLWKDGEVYESGQTVGGSVTLGFTAATEGTLYVTVSGHNYIPYEGTAAIDAAASASQERPDRHDRTCIVSAVPNPFGTATEIRYAIPTGPTSGEPVLGIYNCLGRRIRTLDTLARGPGTHTAVWDGKDDKGVEVASGTYYCELRSGRVRDTHQILLIR